MHNLVAVQWAPAWVVALLVLSTPVAASEQGPFKYEQAWALAGPCCGDSGHDAAADPDGKSEGFVAILDNDGAIRQVLAITGPGHDQPRGVAFAPDGQSLSLTGFVRLTADFDGDGVPEGGVRCDSDGDIVWARYELRAR